MNRRAIAGAMLGVVVSTPWAGADEDYHKMIDRVPPVFGPVWRMGDPVPRSGGFDASGVTLYSHVPLNNFGLAGTTAGNDCWGYVSPSGREYAIMGLSNGFGFVEITDPINPVIVGTVPSIESIWHDVKVIGHYAYGVSQDGLGIQVVDLSDIDNGVIDHIHDWRANGHSRTHNIISNPEAGTLWLCGGNFGNGGLIALDMTNPEEPTAFAGWTDMYVHDAQVVTMHAGPFAGREIAFCASGLNGGQNQTGVRIVDVTDPVNPIVLSTFQYPGAQYCHQVWITDDQQYAFINDELDETRGFNARTRTRVVDISDLTSPFLADTFQNTTTATDHNNYVRGDYLYQANYRSGLRVLDISSPTNPQEIAFFDTHPGSEVKGFGGAWSTFPFFPSGTVIVSDMQRGLFVMRVDAADESRLDLALDSALPEQLTPAGGDTLTVSIDPVGAAIEPGSVELVFDDGSGPTPVPGSEGPGDSWGFAFPPAACGTARYHVTARTTAGETFTLPALAPHETFASAVAEEKVTVLTDDFEFDTGWTVSGDVSGAGAGEWERAVPGGDGSLGDPPADSDGSGMCWVTGNGGPGANADVDAGTTILTSPAFDLSARPEARVEYDRWYDNTASGQFPSAETMTAEISDDDGATWVVMETLGLDADSSTGGWNHAALRVADFVDTSSTVRVRFVAKDTLNAVIEAGVDAFEITDFVCSCPADCDGSGALNVDDIDCFVAAFLGGDLAGADCDGSGALDVDDVDCYVAAFLAGCP